MMKHVHKIVNAIQAPIIVKMDEVIEAMEDSKLHDLESKIESLESTIYDIDMSEVEVDLSEIESAIENIDLEVDLSEVEGKVENLEYQLSCAHSELSSEIDDVSEQVVAVTDEIEELKGMMAEILKAVKPEEEEEDTADACLPQEVPEEDGLYTEADVLAVMQKMDEDDGRVTPTN